MRFFGCFLVGFEDDDLMSAFEPSSDDGGGDNAEASLSSSLTTSLFTPFSSASSSFLKCADEEAVLLVGLFLFSVGTSGTASSMSGSSFGFRAKRASDERVDLVARGGDGFESVRRARAVSCETREVRIAACGFPYAEGSCGLSLGIRDCSCSGWHVLGFTRVAMESSES